METIVDRIRALCRKMGTSITKIEVELRYANGTIGKWAKAKRQPPLEKVIAVADKLGCSAEYLLTGEQKEKLPIVSDEELDATLIEKLIRLTPEELEKVDAFVQGLIAARGA